MRHLVLLLLAAFAALPARAADLSGLDWTQRQGSPVPLQAPLRDAEGRATSLAEVARGLPLIVAPGYFRCPNLCGVVRDDLFAALEASPLRPGQDYAVALVTIDGAEGPAEAAAALAGIADRYPGAHPAALTGPEDSLRALSTAIGFNARFDAESRQFLHPAGAVVLTPSGRVSGYLLGLGYAPDAIGGALALARAEESAPAEPIHLFCFSYDPGTGRVSMAAMEAVRLVSMLSVLGIGGFLFHLYRRP